MALTALLLTQVLVAQGLVVHGSRTLCVTDVRLAISKPTISMEVIDNRRAAIGKKSQAVQFGTDPRDAAGTRETAGHWEFPAPGEIGTLDSMDMLEDALDCSDHVRASETSHARREGPSRAVLTLSHMPFGRSATLSC
jgi:hypothetical protein